MNSVSLVGYGLAFLIAAIIAARWIYRHHPALRDGDLDPPKTCRDELQGGHQDFLKAPTRPLPRD